MPRSHTGLVEEGWRLDCSRLAVSTSVLSYTSSFTLSASVTSRTGLTETTMWRCTGTTSGLEGLDSSSLSPGLTPLHPSTPSARRTTNLTVMMMILSL